MPLAPHRRQAVEQARSLLACHPLFLDTETTGLDDRAQIVEICILDENGAVLFESLVKPKGKIPPDVIRIHHITDDMVRGEPTWAEVWPEVERVLCNRRTAIYNADFDVRMMKQSHARHKLPWLVNEQAFICLMKLYAQFHGEMNYRYGSYRWHSLSAAACHCGISIHDAHRARADALAAMKLLRHMAGQPC